MPKKLRPAVDLMAFKCRTLKVKEKRRYWQLKEEALDRTLWRTRSEEGYGLVVRQST
jgi:hypothetical protein